MEKVLELNDIYKSFGSHHILNGVNLSLKRGESLSILGEGGSGKSVLVKIMAGLLPPSQGQVHILGQSLNSDHHQQDLMKRVGIGFQQGALFDSMTVQENLYFAMENMTSFSKEEMENRVVKFLTWVNLPHAAKKLPMELSGGMRRRVGIIRALITNPEVAFLDEPTAGLDPVTSSIVINMIHSIGEELKTSLVCVTSSVEVAFTFSTRVAVLKDGIIVGEGNWNELLNLNNKWIKDMLLLRKFTPPSLKGQNGSHSVSGGQDP